MAQKLGPVNICGISQRKVLGRHLHPEKCMTVGDAHTEKRCIHTQTRRDADKDTQVCTQPNAWINIRTGSSWRTDGEGQGESEYTLEKQR